MKLVTNQAQSAFQGGKSRVKVGILHSLRGTMAISETSLKDAVLMAIAEINQTGGVLGKIIEPEIADGASQPEQFAIAAEKLIVEDSITNIFGCWTSASRKAVLPILEKFNAQLWYPVQYEGLECSKNIFYTGLCPNQQIVPAVQWLLQNHRKKFYLLGSNYVFPRTAHKIVKAQLTIDGGLLMGENFVPLGHQNFQQIIEKIKMLQPDVVLSTLNGDSNLAFYQQYQAAGIAAEDMPIMALSIAEEELRQIGGMTAQGHYATWSYFQSIDSPQNQDFVNKFQASYGSHRVTSDPIEAAYIQVYLWKQAVETAGCFDVDLVRAAAGGQTFDAPSGTVTLESNNHLAKTCRIGKITPSGQFEIIYTSDRPIFPQPWLGVEQFNCPASSLAIALLGEFAQGIQSQCQMEENTCELKVAMAELQAANQNLLQVQNQVRKLSQREELLKRRLSSQIRNSLDFGTSMKTAVNEICDLLQIDRCQFFWYRDDVESPTFELIHEAENNSSLNADLSPAIAAVGQLILRQKLLRLNDINSDRQLKAHNRQILTNVGLKSLLAASIHTHSGEIGTIVCEHSRPRAWTDDEVELLQDIAEQLAIAINQSKLYQQSRFSAAVATAQAAQLKKALEELKATQAQLIQTEKMSSLGQMIAGIAHEINNPVSFISGNLEYTEKYVQDLLELVRLFHESHPQPVTEVQKYIEEIELDFLSEDLPKMLASMKVGAERIFQIVLSLRNFSRTDEGEMKPSNIHEGIDSTLLILQNRLKPRGNYPGIRIIKAYGELPLIDCYAGQLNQVFMNLLGNAIDALEESNSKSGQPRIPEITIRTEILQPDFITIRIADNGLGMTAEINQKLFDPFFTTKPVGKGTGLGLSISYQIIVEKHQGSLKCVSAPGAGAEFWIELPIRQPNQSEISDSKVAQEAA